MSTGAKVTSVEAIESFRNQLIIYLSKARPTLDDILSDVTRVRVWVENDQRMRWEGELRRRKQRLEEAQNAFFSAQMSHLREPTVAERLALTKARTAFEEGEAKLRTIKQWNREITSQVEPLAKQLEHLHTMMASELPAAIAFLSKVSETLQAYASAGSIGLPPDATGPTATTTSQETDEPK